MSNPVSKKNKEILILGGSGFIGSAIAEHLSSLGFNIRLVSRQGSLENQLSFPCKTYQWDGLSIPEKAIHGAEAVINLVGQAIADQSWSKSYRAKICNSRIQASRALTKAISALSQKPSLVIQASAVGYYDTQELDAPCDESTKPGNDFLGRVCQQWENEAAAIGKQTRLCVMRTGIVLGWTGGALPKLWDIYSSGLGSILGNGKQWMNWIHITDLVRFVELAIDDSKFEGVFNLVAPENTSNRNFHERLCQETRSFEFLKTPSFLLKLLLGQRAQLLLKGPHVKPKALLSQNFSFLFPNINSAIDNLISERIYRNASFLKTKQWVPASLDQVWDFVSAAENLEKITPDFLGFHVDKISTAQIQKNSIIDYKLKIHGLPVKWRSEITEWQSQKFFADKQLKGPYKLWFHRHLFKAHAGGTLIEDLVEYTLPFFPFGQVALPFVQNDVHKIFSYRKKKMAEIFSKK